MTAFEAIPYLTDPTGREHPLQGAVSRIGRAVENEIVISSKRVSREHACLRREGRKVLLEDMGSTNGTLLNNELINTAHELRDGDRISVGDVEFIFHDPDTTYQDSGFLRLEVNPAAGVIRLNRKPVELSPKEYALLVYLYENKGRICTKDEISRAVWPEFSDGIFDYQIENLVRRLRTRLEPDPANARLLLTVRGQGYKLEIRE
jgi:pSer/pThr/pTyr-binding forkhead associated (FHA) protein